MKTRLISVTREAGGCSREAEDLIVYCARVSSDRTDEEKFKDTDKLIKYLIKHQHWSPFEMTSMCVEIVTSRAIARQILRHRSFSFQEFSQRYSDNIKFETVYPRQKGTTNRQGSVSITSDALFANAFVTIEDAIEAAEDFYKHLIKMGVAPECARMILPECTQTTLYMNGTIRSWIHYLQIRTEEHTQREHREVALSIRDTIFKKEFPVISQALGWNTVRDEAKA